MTRAGWISGCLLIASMVTGTLADTPPPPRAVVVLGGYRVLAADFHVHSHPLSWASLTPWDTVLEAKRQGLDVIAMTGHNHVWVSQVGRWFSRRIGGPTVLVSEEIANPTYHLIATGITSTVGWRLTAAGAIAEIHRQGGVAIAAHPYRDWPGYDDEAVRLLDAAEVVRPEVYTDDHAARQLHEFFQRKPMTAIGSSDYHGLGRPGYSRTFVFTRDVSDAGILDALRQGRTVVYGRDHRAYGDPELIPLASERVPFDARDVEAPESGALALFSRVSGLVGLAGLLLFGSRKQA